MKNLRKLCLLVVVLVTAMNNLTACSTLGIGGTASSQEAAADLATRSMVLTGTAIKATGPLIESLYATGVIKSAKDYNRLATLRDKVWANYLTANDALQLANKIGGNPNDVQVYTDALTKLLLSKNVLDTLIKNTNKEAVK